MNFKGIIITLLREIKRQNYILKMIYKSSILLNISDLLMN